VNLSDDDADDYGDYGLENNDEDNGVDDGKRSVSFDDDDDDDDDDADAAAEEVGEEVRGMLVFARKARKQWREKSSGWRN